MLGHAQQGTRTGARSIVWQMTRSVNQAPMTAGQVLLAAARVLHDPDDGRSVADPQSPRGIVLRAIGYLAQEQRQGATAELSRLDQALSRFSAPSEARDAILSLEDCPHIAYCRDTDLIWGYGETLARCQADAGWHVKEAGAGEQMALIDYLPAGSGMLEAIERYGMSAAWTVRDGVAVPTGT